jgi:serine/threonine protein kinase
LGRGGFGEVWKCEAPGGLLKAIKFVYGYANALDTGPVAAEEELNAVERVKAIRHPFLLSMERVEWVRGELVIVMELADRNLHDLLKEQRSNGHQGIVRETLLGYMREVAEALDLMNFEHHLQHLDIKPRNLFLVSNHVKVGDFGLVNSLRAKHLTSSPAPQLGAITPLYAAPEIFFGNISPHCDQYSLAIVYQELLTGGLPFNGTNSRQLLFQHVQCDPDLQALPSSDAAAVARALTKDPSARYGSCMEFVEALVGRPLSSHSLLLPEMPGTINGAQRAAGRDTALLDLRGLTETKVDQAVYVPNGAKKQVAKESPGGSDPLEGCQFLDCLGCSPLAEAWKIRDANGQERLVKYVYGFTGHSPEREAEVVGRLGSLSHPGLVPAQVVRHDPGRLVLVSELHERSLWNRFQESQEQHLGGIPEAELRGYIRALAEVLDQLFVEHAIHHLSLNPRNLWFEDGRIRMADFGLAHLLWLPAGQSVAQFNARYAAPELLDFQVSRSSDQYSLALIFAEMLTGASPRGCRVSRQAFLKDIPSGMKDILDRALDPNPGRRWNSCVEMVRALETHGRGKRGYLTLGDKDRATAQSSANPLDRGEARDIETTIESDHPVTVAPDGSGQGRSESFLLRRFAVPLTRGKARAKLEEFRQQINAKLVRENSEHVVLAVVRPRSLWQQCLGRQPGLELDIRLAPCDSPSGKSIEATVQIKPFGANPKHAAELLNELGPLFLESVRACLQVPANQRKEKRESCHQPLHARALFEGGSTGDPIECQTKDISPSGIGLYLPCALQTTRILIDLPALSADPATTVAANIVRVERRGDGWYEVGALFASPEDSTAANARLRAEAIRQPAGACVPAACSS